jgi:hypothetical protein
MWRFEENVLFEDIDSEAGDFMLNILILMVKLHKVRTGYERRLNIGLSSNFGFARDEGKEWWFEATWLARYVSLIVERIEAGIPRREYPIEMNDQSRKFHCHYYPGALP